VSIKKVILLFSLALTLVGQNFQLHYEASEDREYLVSTLEMFKPDDWGSTFWFVDMEYDDGEMSLAYWEIVRNLTLPINNLSATVQYNDGVANFGNLGKVWLAGINYFLQIGDLGLPVDLLYRNLAGSSSADFQITTSWYIPLMGEKVEFSGFLDIWSQDSGDDGKDIVFLSEPQLWYHLGKSLSVGSEVEISQNFIFGKSDIQFLPTLAMRWQF